MNTLKIYPAGKDKVEAYFEVVICDSSAQFSEWEDDVRPDDYSYFLPNTTDPQNMDKFATILLRKDKLDDSTIVHQASRAGLLFAEIMATLLEDTFKTAQEADDYYRDCASQTTQFIFQDIKNYISKHYVAFSEG